MANYKVMYTNLFNVVTDAVDIHRSRQRNCLQNLKI